MGAEFNTPIRPVELAGASFSLQQSGAVPKRWFADWEDDELVGEWTLEPSDQSLLANKAGATRLGFVASLTLARQEKALPTSKHEVPAAVVTHLARQVEVPVEACVAYEWRGRTIKYHLVQTRTALGLRSWRR